MNLLLAMTLSVEKVAALIVNTLAVAGGVLIGAVLADLLTRLAVKLTLKKKAPYPALLIVRSLGGIGLGLLVYLIVFSGGGSGWGSGGPGGWLFGGKGEGAGGETAPTQPAATQKADTKAEDKTKGAGDPEPVVLRVEMLGGPRVQEQRFYVLEGDKEALTLAALREALRERRLRRDKPPVKGIEIVIYDDSVAEVSPAVADLKQWARENELPVSVSFPKK